MSCICSDQLHDAGAGYRITKEFRLWWDPKSPQRAALWRSVVVLSRDFYDEVIQRPVPVDMRALKALKRSPLSLDIYCWLSYRMSYLKKPTTIPWRVLQMQFGADYAVDKRGRYDFKRAFLRHLKAVRLVYPEAKAEEVKGGLRLRPSKPHVPALSSG